MGGWRLGGGRRKEMYLSALYNAPSSGTTAASGFGYLTNTKKTNH